MCAFRRRVLCSKPPFPVQMGSTHPSHAMRDTPHHSQEVCPLPPLFRVKDAPPSYLRLCDHEGGLPPPNPHPIYGSYISRRILWIPLVSFKIFRRIPWNLRISFQNISKNPPLLLVLFQNFLKNPLDSSCIPLNILKNPGGFFSSSHNTRAIS